MPFLLVPITSANSIDKRVILGEKVDFSQFYKIFSYFFNRFNSRILTYPP